jgi:hypothetical protein
MVVFGAGDGTGVVAVVAAGSCASDAMETEKKSAVRNRSMNRVGRELRLFTPAWSGRKEGEISNLLGEGAVVVAGYAHSHSVATNLLFLLFRALLWGLGVNSPRNAGDRYSIAHE